MPLMSCSFCANDHGSIRLAAMFAGSCRQVSNSLQCEPEVEAIQIKSNNEEAMVVNKHFVVNADLNLY